MIRKALTFLLFFISLSLGIYAQNQEKIDSLLRVNKNLSPGKPYVDNLNELSRISRYIDGEKALEYAEDARDLSREINYDYGLGKALNNIGVMYWFAGDFKQSKKVLKKSISIRKRIGDTSGVAGGYINLGIIAMYQGDLDSGVYYQRQARNLKELIGDSLGVASAEGNIGMMKEDMGEIDSAIYYQSKAIKIYEKMEDWNGVANAYGNIANCFDALKDYQKALEYNYKSVAAYKRNNSTKGVAACALGMGMIHLDLNQLDSALYYERMAMKILEELGDKYNAASAKVNLGRVFFETEHKDSAYFYVRQGIKIQEEMGDYANMPAARIMLADMELHRGNVDRAIALVERALPKLEEGEEIDWTLNAFLVKSKAYAAQQDYKTAFEAYKKYDSLENKLNSEKNFKTLNELEKKYQTEKKELENAKLKEENKRKDALEAKRQTQISMLFGGIALVIVFALFLYGRFRVIRSQRNVIQEQKSTVEKQKDLVEEKNQEILDSINYAKRIQSAILPPQKLVKEYIPESFILYKPKDIVAGDFYWMEPQKDGVIFAAADCTGHGVPGAMVSVVCNNGLNRSVREHGLTQPAKILGKTREIVIAEFEKSEEEVKDGMDIALCTLHTHTPTHSVLQYAGAHNPLWIIRKGAEEIEEIKADKQPIGKFGAEQPFTNHTVEIQKGDSIYIFSDGYADQFGGEKGKKFKSKNFKKLLLSVQNETMERQRQLLDDAFEEWKGEIEQLDDVCVIGVRV